MFTPFAFIKSAAVVSTWTPADLTNVLYWWYTGAGVTTSGTGVTAWEDQITSRTLSVEAGTPMIYNAADSQFNNLPSIYNSGSNATLSNASLTGDIASGDPFTQIWIGKPNTVGSATYAIWGGETSTGAAASELAPYTSGPDAADVPGYYRFAYDGSGRTNTTAVTSGGSLIYHIVAVDTPNGVISQYWNSTTVNQSSTLSFNSADRVPFRWEIGGYTNALKYQGFILECIVMKALPTAQELSDINTYVQNTYA